MANARGKAIDNTHLSIDQAHKRGFIHRDYLGHCLRWTHVSKFLRQSARYKNAVVLDIGCGRDLPLARMLHTDRMSPACYIGVDYNKLEKLNEYDHNFGDKEFYIYGSVAFPEGVEVQVKKVKDGTEASMLVQGVPHPLPNVITCFEVLEHVEPAHAREMVRGIVNICKEQYNRHDIFISTPNWDPKVGAADNHVNEMLHPVVGYLLESEGLAIENFYGTFASQKDYDLGEFGCDTAINRTPKQEARVEMLHELWTQLSDYYDSNYLSTIFAPLFPAQARNCLWHCTLAEDDYEHVFGTPDPEELGQLTSSEKWREILL